MSLVSSPLAASGTPPLKIAVLEDDPVYIAIYRTILGRAGYEVALAGTVAEFVSDIAQRPHDLQLLDWTLPDGTAADVISWTRSNLGWRVPIIVASLHSDEDRVVHALSLGADDYIVKPIRVQEALARISAHLRKTPPGDQRAELAPYRIDLRNRRVTRDDVAVDLTPKEFDLLWCLFRHRGRLVPRAQLMDTVWGVLVELDTRTVDAHVSRLRKKLALSEQTPWTISSSYGHGYRLAPRGE